MDFISYKKTRQEKSTPSPRNSAWFGTNSILTRLNLPLYADNSFKKQQQTSVKDQRHLNEIQNKHSKAKIKVEKLRSQIHFSYLTKKQLLTVFTRKSRKKEIKEKSAVTIQKFIRGFLTRKKYLPELMALQRKVLQIRIQGLEKSSKHHIYFLGKAPVKAVIKIQQSVRRFLFRLKLRKYLLYYDYMVRISQEKIYSVIRKHLTVYLSKIKIETERFLEYRKTRLEQIKRNLAILTVSIIYKKNRWSFKIIRHRISKYKRKIKNAVIEIQPNSPGFSPITGQSSKARLSVQGSEIEQIAVTQIEVNNLELISSTSSSEDSRVQREMLMKQAELARKNRVKYGKISYSVRSKPKSSHILPLLYAKDLVESIKTFSRYGNITRATAFRFSASEPKRSSPALFKSKTPVPVTRFVSKRKDQDPLPLYQRETVAFKLSKNIQEEPESKSTAVPRRRNFNSTVYKFTVSQMQKRRSKSVKVEEESSRAKTSGRPLRNFVKKVTENRPYILNTNLLVFRPDSVV